MKFGLLKKATIMLAAGLLCAQPLAYGQDTNTTDRAAMARERMQEMAKELNLTPEQKEKLKAIMQEEIQKAKAIRDDSSLRRLQKARKLKAIRDDATPKVKAILTPEQFKKWQELRKENRENWRENRKK
jgi:Spy/CpxP family protein refolding chaperone